MAGGLCVRAQCLRFQEFLKIFSPLSALRAGSEKILRNSWKRTHDECYDNNVTKFLTLYFLPVVYTLVVYGLIWSVWIHLSKVYKDKQGATQILQYVV